MKKLLLIFAAAMFSSSVMAADPKPSEQCWADGTCLSESLVPVPPAKAENDETHALRPGEFNRPRYQPPIYYLPSPLIYTPAAPTPSICYVLVNGVYSPIPCPPVTSLPHSLPRPRRR